MMEMGSPHFDSFHRRITIDRDLCLGCSIFNDSWNRKGVTPFAIACYLWHSIHTLNKDPEEAYAFLMDKWDSLVWKYSPIGIDVWNKLFNGDMLTSGEWGKVLFPLNLIDTIETSVTSPSVRRSCHPLFMGASLRDPGEFLVCSDEGYVKALVNKTAVKVTAYRYGHASGNRDIIEGLRHETTRVVMPI